MILKTRKPRLEAMEAAEERHGKRNFKQLGANVKRGVSGGGGGKDSVRKKQSPDYQLPRPLLRPYSVMSRKKTRHQRGAGIGGRKEARQGHSSHVARWKHKRSLGAAFSF